MTALGQQLDLVDYIANYRARDPVTSAEAGEHARKFIGAHHQAIMGALRAAGRPMAPEEIADALGWPSHVAANRRTTELERAGLIAVADQYHVNRSGRRARRYRLVP